MRRSTLWRWLRWHAGHPITITVPGPTYTIRPEDRYCILIMETDGDDAVYQWISPTGETWEWRAAPRSGVSSGSSA